MSERLRYPELAPDGIAAMRALEHYLNATTALPAVLLELVRLRASLLNGCGFCIGHHTRELEKHNEPVTRIEALGDWAAADAFTPRERAALAWTEVLTNVQGSHASDAEYEAVSVFFSGKDLVDLTLSIASINAWNRMSIAFAATWDAARGKTTAPAAHDADLASPGTSRQRPSCEEPARGRGGLESHNPANGTAAVSRPATQTTAATATTPAHADAHAEDVVHDDGGKVTHD